MKKIEFDVDAFIKEQDTLNIFDDYRINRPSIYDYIKILFKQAYLAGSIDALDLAIIKYKD